MANNPVQVVLNSSNFVIQPDPLPHPTNNKDFYKDRDPQFSAHKKTLLGTIQEIRTQLQRHPDVGVDYAHVDLQGDAWAKSNRPTHAIMPPAKVPLIGGGRLGELLVELTAENIEVVEKAIQQAEEKVQLKEAPNGEQTPKPSRNRSEVGAIEMIRLHQPTDRRGFSAEDAAKWLKDPRTGGFYIVETFADLSDFSQNNHGRPRAQKALQQFVNSLSESKLPIELVKPPARLRARRLIFLRVRIGQDEEPQSVVRTHQSVLEYLDKQAAVRRILLPPIIEAPHVAAAATATTTALLAPKTDATYAVVGIVDTGVAQTAGLETWCAGRSDVVGTPGQDRSHGTFIGGIACAADQLNAHELFAEQPCKFFDLALYPTPDASFDSFYPNGFLDFLDQLHTEVIAAKSASKIRVFNMSLALERQVTDDTYSVVAEAVDKIADENDIVFVLPSGNILPANWRDEWPDGDAAALKMLAEYRHTGNDRILQPAESIRAIVTGALNPPSCSPAALRPCTYTRRGPSAALGAKPDVAHIGGRGKSTHELTSVSPNGTLIQGCGTSYAAPFVAKVVANLDHLIEGDVPRETLIALLVHHSNIPKDLATKNLAKVARDFVGFGMPLHCDQMLSTGDHSITLIFNASLGHGQELIFPFSWPASLATKDGKCRGRVRLTLAYRPTIDPAFDAEFVRANLDAHLRQEQIDRETGEVMGWKGRLTTESDKRYEKQLIEHGQKWSPVKQYEKAFQRTGSSSQWRLVVEGLARAATRLPPEGVPFSVILTIEDPTKKEDVFREMRQGLQTAGAAIADVRTANRVRTQT
jgi:hypothetical protein